MTWAPGPPTAPGLSVSTTGSATAAALQAGQAPSILRAPCALLCRTQTPGLEPCHLAVWEGPGGTVPGDGLCAGPLCRWRRRRPWPGQLCGLHPVRGGAGAESAAAAGQPRGLIRNWGLLLGGPRRGQGRRGGTGDAPTEPGSPRRIQSPLPIVRGAVRAAPPARCRWLCRSRLPHAWSGPCPSPQDSSLSVTPAALVTPSGRRTVTLLFGGAWLLPPSAPSRVYLGAALGACLLELPGLGVSLLRAPLDPGPFVCEHRISRLISVCGDVLNTLRQPAGAAQWLSVDP